MSESRRPVWVWVIGLFYVLSAGVSLLLAWCTLAAVILYARGLARRDVLS